MRGIGLAVLVAFGVTGSASAMDCRLDGQVYPPDVTICSGGLAVSCVNGSWQNNDGRRCDEPTGSYVGARRPLVGTNPEPIPEYYREAYPGLKLD